MFVCTESSIFIIKLSRSESTKSIYLEVQTMEYTQSGDCRFLAYIPSWWKKQPWLVRVGGARPPLSAYYNHVQSWSVPPAERRYTPSQCCGSMTFWCGSGSGSGSADPCLWLMYPDEDPDPAIFFLLIYIYIIFKDKKSKRSRKAV